MKARAHWLSLLPFAAIVMLVVVVGLAIVRSDDAAPADCAELRSEWRSLALDWKGSAAARSQFDDVREVGARQCGWPPVWDECHLVGYMNGPPDYCDPILGA